MTPRTRLRRIESAMATKGREPETVAQMSDDELAECIGGPGTRAADLTDRELEELSDGE